MTAKSSTSSPFKANLIPRRISKANAVHGRGYYFLKVSPATLFHRSTTSQQVTSFQKCQGMVRRCRTSIEIAVNQRRYGCKKYTT
jgi:hypothetical protein